MSEPTATEQTEQHDGPEPVEKDGVLYVPLKLAHPLDKATAERIGAIVKKDYNVGNTIKVIREWGLALIEGGRVQVDPTDKAAVRKALFLNTKNQPLTAEELAGVLGGGDAGAAVPARTEGQQSAADTAKPAKRGSGN